MIVRVVQPRAVVAIAVIATKVANDLSVRAVPRQADHGVPVVAAVVRLVERAAVDRAAHLQRAEADQVVAPVVDRDRIARHVVPRIASRRVGSKRTSS